MKAPTVTRTWRCAECLIDWAITAPTAKAALDKMLPISIAHVDKYHRGKASLYEVTEKNA